MAFCVVNATNRAPANTVAVATGCRLWYSPPAMNGADDRLRWEEKSRRRVASSPLFDIYTALHAAADGRTGECWVLDAPDWVNVVPVLEEQGQEARFVMVRQFRHGAAMITTEFPAGLVERGEDPRVAAARELLEETGYRAARLTALGKVQPNPAFMGNWCHTFLAQGLVPAAGAHLDALEVLDAVAIPVAEVERLMGTGEYVNSLALVALTLYHKAITER
jgi:ADP-ribose pyrophosphatase